LKNIEKVMPVDLALQITLARRQQSDLVIFQVKLPHLTTWKTAESH